MEDKPENGPPEMGQWVEFIVKVNDKGQPQARNVVWLEGKIDPAKMAQDGKIGEGSTPAGSSTVTGGISNVIGDVREASPVGTEGNSANSSANSACAGDQGATAGGSFLFSLFLPSLF